ncbi:MAG: LIC12162 family protein [Desulfovibrionaceae bacterium]|nr:LIC12162 family protein [Desulfovibrionaceae bacterium]
MRRLILCSAPDDFDPGRDILLGPWCLHHRQADLDLKGLALEPDPFATPAELKKASDLSAAHGAGLVPDLAKSLNEANRTSHSVGFWRMLLANWLVGCVQVAYERQARIDSALKKYGSTPLAVELMPRDVQWHFTDSMDYYSRGAQGLDYNHWLLSRLLETRLPRAWSAEYRTGCVKIRGNDPGTCFSESLGNAPGRARCQGVYGMRRRHSALLSLLLALKPALPVAPAQDRPRPEAGEIEWSCDIKAVVRASLPEIFLHLDSFGFGKTKVRPGKCRVIGPVLYFKEEDKVHLAQCREAGERIICTQHGGGYGTTLAHPSAAEVEYAQDAYITWGWDRHNDYPGRFLALASPFLSSLRNKYRQQTSELVLVGTTAPLLPFRLQSTSQPLQRLGHRREKVRFLQDLEPNIFSRVRYRFHPLEITALEDRGFFARRFPDLAFCEKDLHARILGCRLLVLDHPGTTLSMALAANIPFVAFWDDASWPMCEQAEPYFRALREAGAFFETGAQAAAKVNAIWDHVQDWWREATIQEARLNFARRYARTSAFWLWQWAKTLWRFK